MISIDIVQNIIGHGIYDEWALIVFTTFIQMTIGISFFGALASIKNQEKTACMLWRTALVTLVIAGIGSIFHLQNPANAFYTITQVADSWLSREIVSVGIFGLCILFLALLPKHSCTPTIGKITPIVGLIVLYCVTQVYVSVESFVLWTCPVVTLSFLGTTLLLGSAVAKMYIGKVEDSCLKIAISSGLMIGAILTICAPSLWLPALLNSQVLFIETPFFENFICLTSGHILFLILGVLMIMCKKQEECKCVPALAIILLICGELIGRTLFFLAQIRIGL